MSLELRKKYFGTELDAICLLGSAPSSLRLAPFGSDKWAMCGCSPGVYGVAPRSESWVELHRYEPGQTWFSPEYCQFLASYPGPVWMSEKLPQIPNSVELPLVDLITKYSPYFFTSSLAYMMAMAIECGFKRIGLFGVDMAAASEYKDQRLGCQYFALIAKSRGIEVGVPPESDLFRPAPLYGVSETSHARIKILARRRELEGRVNAALQAQQQAKDETLYLRGALEDLEWAEMDWTGNVDGPSNCFLEPPTASAMQQFVLNMTEIEDKEEPDVAEPKTGDIIWTEGPQVKVSPDES